VSWVMRHVSPGDWVLGDDDGVVVVPKDRAVEFANRAMDVLERENRIRAEIVAGSRLERVAVQPDHRLLVKLDDEVPTELEPPEGVPRYLQVPRLALGRPQG